jgi:hypothetical protein
MLEFSRLIEVSLSFWISDLTMVKLICQDEAIPKSTSVLVHADILCICAQFSGILLDPNVSKDLLKAQVDDAQKLLDLLQDVSKCFDHGIFPSSTDTQALGLSAPRFSDLAGTFEGPAETLEKIQTTSAVLCTPRLTTGRKPSGCRGLW